MCVRETMPRLCDNPPHTHTHTHPCAVLLPATTYYSPEGKGDDGDEQATSTAGGGGLHFVKLRPEPVTGGNIRNLVQVSRLLLVRMSSTYVYL